MLSTHWLALAAFALLFTLLWLADRPRQRLYFTASFAGFAWAICAYAAPGVEVVDAGQTVAAPVDPAIQYVTAALALISLVVVVLHRFGGYPPELATYSDRP